MASEIKLNPSHVHFDEEAHTYTLGDKTLHGITDVIRRQVTHEAPYMGPASATEYGKSVHSTIELGDAMGGYDEPNEAYDTYKALITAQGWQVVRNEYIVTDGECFASGIDIVLTNADGDIILADIKTTSKLHHVKVAWQLSIYKYFFGLLNHELKDRKFILAAIWLPNPDRGETPCIEIEEEIDPFEVYAMLKCEKFGLEYVPKPVADLGNELALTHDAICEVVAVERQLALMQEKSKELRAGLLKLMQEHNVKTFDTDRLRLTRKAATESLTFDADRFKADHPELYEEYKTKKRKTAESIMLKIREV